MYIDKLSDGVNPLDNLPPFKGWGRFERKALSIIMRNSTIKMKMLIVVHKIMNE